MSFFDKSPIERILEKLGATPDIESWWVEAVARQLEEMPDEIDDITVSAAAVAVGAVTSKSSLARPTVLPLSGKGWLRREARRERTASVDGGTGRGWRAGIRCGPVLGQRSDSFPFSGKLPGFRHFRSHVS